MNTVEWPPSPEKRSLRSLEVGTFFVYNEALWVRGRATDTRSEVLCICISDATGDASFYLELSATLQVDPVNVTLTVDAAPFKE